MEQLEGINNGFDLFIEWYKSNNAGRIPADIQEAKYAREGKRRHPLGLNRLCILIEKYAKTVFTVSVAVKPQNKSGETSAIN